MKKIYLSLALSLLLSSPIRMNAQVAFMEVKTQREMEQALQRASDQMLMLFVDVYASWCGPCKMMDQDVYARSVVGDYMNTHFVSVRLDGESEFGRKYAAEMGLRGYPSMFVFSDDGEKISSIVGYRDATELISTLEGIQKEYKTYNTYRARYQQGKLMPEEYPAYIETLRALGLEEEANEMASTYVEQQMGQTLTDNDIRVVAFHMDLDDWWWAEFRSDQGRIRRILERDYMLSMEKIYNNTLVKAINEQRIELISRMANELAPMAEEESPSWDLRSLPFLQYYYYTNQLDELLSWVDGRFAADRKDDPRWLYGAASQIVEMDRPYRTPRLLQKEVAWFEACIALEEHFDYYFYHGMVLFMLKEANEAKRSFLKAESLAFSPEEKQMIAEVMQFVNRE